MVKHRIEHNIDVYDATLCHERWYKSTLSKNVVPVSGNNETRVIQMATPTRALTKTEKYHKINTVLQAISDDLTNLPQGQFNTYYEELVKCRDFIHNDTVFSGKFY